MTLSYSFSNVLSYQTLYSLHCSVLLGPCCHFTPSVFVHNPGVSTVCCLHIDIRPFLQGYGQISPWWRCDPFLPSAGCSLALYSCFCYNTYILCYHSYFCLSYFGGTNYCFSSYYLNSEHNSVYLVAFNKFVDYLIKVLFFSGYEGILDRLIVSHQVLFKK